MFIDTPQVLTDLKASDSQKRKIKPVTASHVLEKIERIIKMGSKKTIIAEIVYEDKLYQGIIKDFLAEILEIETTSKEIMLLEGYKVIDIHILKIENIQ